MNLTYDKANFYPGKECLFLEIVEASGVVLKITIKIRTKNAETNGTDPGNP